VTDATPAPSLFAILELVEKRPAMYVGFSESERGDQLRNLEMLIIGYALAVRQYGLRDAGWEAYVSFPDYLEERFGWSMSCGPIAAIRSASPDDRDAWERFWALLREFRARHADAGKVAAQVLVGGEPGIGPRE
jgi:hypothetical protein